MFRTLQDYIKSNFLTLGLLVVVFGYIVYQQGPAFVNAMALRGRPAPDFFLSSLDKGQPRRLSEERGRRVLLAYWATWCAPCVQEVPIFTRLHTELGGRGDFTLLAVTADRPDVVRRFAEAHEIPYAVLLDTLGQAHEAYGVRLFPTLVWIDPQGRIESVSNGVVFFLEARVRYWVTGSPFAPATTPTGERP